MQTRLILSATLVATLFLALAGCSVGPQRIITVNAPQINCLFSTNCTVTVNDSTAPITFTNSTGSGFLQSRTYQGLPGTPEAGRYAFEYRIDLTGISGSPSNNIDSLTLDLGELIPFTYGGQPSNQVWTVTGGGLGVVGPSAVYSTGTNYIFIFNPPVWSGTSSYFFGVISQFSPTNFVGRITSFEGPPPGNYHNKSILVRSPAYH